MHTTRILALCSLCSLIACNSGGGGAGGGGGTNQNISQVVGAGGATLTIGAGPLAGLRLQIPAGALGQSATITVEPDSTPVDPAATAVGPAGLFGPGGTAFSPNATLTLPYDESLLPAGAAEVDLVIKRFDTGGNITTLPTTVDTQANRATAQIPGFSRYQVMLDVRFVEVDLSDYLPANEGDFYGFGGGGLTINVGYGNELLVRPGRSLFLGEGSQTAQRGGVFDDDIATHGLRKWGGWYDTQRVRTIEVWDEPRTLLPARLRLGQPIDANFAFAGQVSGQAAYTGTGTYRGIAEAGSPIIRGSTTFDDVVRVQFEWTRDVSGRALETERQEIHLARGFGPVRIVPDGGAALDVDFAFVAGVTYNF